MSFSQPNTLIQKSVRAFYNGWYRDLVTEVPRIEGGFVYPMEGPGLGTALTPGFFRRTDLARRVSEDSPMSLKLFVATASDARILHGSRRRSVRAHLRQGARDESSTAIPAGMRSACHRYPSREERP
ncbi:hypothetical protein [Brevirhabdus sp.]|uniref:hypothetical protein n=1 Tax=Brevirhabdus sp. TaxID=2004514 RepID=UPI0040588521